MQELLEELEVGFFGQFFVDEALEALITVDMKKSQFDKLAVEGFKYVQPYLFPDNKDKRLEYFYNEWLLHGSCAFVKWRKLFGYILMAGLIGYSWAVMLWFFMDMSRFDANSPENAETNQFIQYGKGFALGQVYDMFLMQPLQLLAFHAGFIFVRKKCFSERVQDVLASPSKFHEAVSKFEEERLRPKLTDKLVKKGRMSAIEVFETVNKSPSRMKSNSVNKSPSGMKSNSGDQRSRQTKLDSITHQSIKQRSETAEQLAVLSAPTPTPSLKMKVPQVKVEHKKKSTKKRTSVNVSVEIEMPTQSSPACNPQLPADINRLSHIIDDVSSFQELVPQKRAEIVKQVREVMQTADETTKTAYAAAVSARLSGVRTTSSVTLHKAGALAKADAETKAEVVNETLASSHQMISRARQLAQERGQLPKKNAHKNMGSKDRAKRKASRPPSKIQFDNI